MRVSGYGMRLSESAIMSSSEASSKFCSSFCVRMEKSKIEGFFSSNFFLSDLLPHVQQPGILPGKEVDSHLILFVHLHILRGHVTGVLGELESLTFTASPVLGAAISLSLSTHVGGRS